MNQMGYMTRSMYVFDLCHLKMYTGVPVYFGREYRKTPETQPKPYDSGTYWAVVGSVFLG